MVKAIVYIDWLSYIVYFVLQMGKTINSKMYPGKPKLKGENVKFAIAMVYVDWLRYMAYYVLSSILKLQMYEQRRSKF